jgi:hypothetical protein
VNTERIVRIHGDSASVVYTDGTKLLIGDTSAGQTTDEYHSFDELYRHRMLITAAWLSGLETRDLVRSPADQFRPHKSRLHSDGTVPFGGGWFIVVAQLPTGQVSYHYPLKDWDLFRIAERERPADFDGHTADDVVARLEAFLRQA